MNRLQTALAAALTGAAGLLAQAPRPPAPALDRVAGVFAHGDELVGVARRYRAAFGARGATFRPALGRDAPRAHALSLELRGIGRGDAPRTAAAHVAPTRAHDRRAVEYRWPWATERYEPRPDGLKHSVVFDELPGGDGDLVVVLDVRAEGLAPDRDAARWLDADGFGVTLGDVVGVDARGARYVGTKRLVPGGVALSLPARFVDAAALPLTVDPLIGTATQAYAGTDNDFPDVAHDAASDTWCVVWTQFLGGGQTAVTGSVWLASPLAFGYAFGINQPAPADSARVTGIAGLGVYVIVWTGYEQAGNWIRGLVLEPTQGIGSAVFDVDGPYDVSTPVLSGEATVLDDDCLVAWLDSSLGVLGTTITVDAQLQPTIAPFAQIAAGPDVYEPAISKQGGANGTHMVTWTVRPVGAPGAIRAQVVDHDMTLLGPAAWIQNGAQNAGYSAVDGDGFKFLVAWEEQEVQNPSTTDVRARVVTAGPGGLTSVGGVLDVVAAPGVIDYAADVAMLGDAFGLAYMSVDPLAIFDDDAFVQVLGPAGAPIGAALPLDVTPGLNYTYEHAPRLIGRRAGDPATTADDGLVVFADQDTAATFDSDVGLQPLEAIGPGGAIADLGGGCGPGGLAVSAGPAALGNAALPLELYGAQPLAVPFVLLGLPGARVSCGVCDFVDPTTAWFVPNTAGTATTTFGIPGNPALVGFAFDVQFVSLNVLYVGCPALPGVAASNVIRVTVDV